jgi:tRNA threonylcarbamoyladenosine biosynthesis protein TsaB
MKILAVDTSTTSGSIALLDGARVMAEETVQSAQTHNRRLLKNMDHFLRELGWSLEDLDGFAVTIGPGSFTGLRIGVTTVKTLAWATGKLFAGISSLDALAAPFGFAALPICPLVDARKSEIYFALYHPDGKGTIRLQGPYRVDSAERIGEKIKGPTIFCGDGWPLCQELLGKKLGALAVVAPAPFHVIRASQVGELARKKFEEQQAEDPLTCTPLYVRPSEAEIHHPHFASPLFSPPQKAQGVSYQTDRAEDRYEIRNSNIEVRNKLE